MKLDLQNTRITVSSQTNFLVDKAFKPLIELPLPKGLTFAPTYLQAIMMAVLIFLLILTLGQLRRRLVNWQLGGIMPGMIAGFTIAIILEGIFVVAGRTILTEFLGWKNAPKPIVNVLDAGRSKMVKVLGVNKEIPASAAAEKPTLEGLINQYSKLSSKQKDSFKSIICEP